MDDAPPGAGRRAGARPARYPALDGLRGVAALVVLVFHVLLVSPIFDGLEPGVRPEEPSWWITHTPLSLLWAGSEAVIVFFVLSGFVLALPARERRISWRAYYPQRMVRLYVPVWASLVLAVAWTLVVPRRDHPELSEWYAAHVPVQDISETARDAVLLVGTGWINSPLWSLRWEVAFSLLLPLYVAGALVLRRAWLSKLAVLLVAVGVAGALGMDRALYLSMFAFGVLLAYEQERVTALARRLVVHGPVPRAVPVLVCVLFISSESALLVLGAESSLARGCAVVLQVVGACLAVLLALHWPPLQRALGHPWVQWLGVRSFSLYLVHEPIVVSVASALPGLPVGVHLVLVLVVSLLFAEAFYCVVERPAQRLSRRAGALTGGRRRVQESAPPSATSIAP